MHPEYLPQDEEDEEHAALSDTAKEHMWAAFTHEAGLGLHPGIYNGPEVKPEATSGPLHKGKNGEGEKAAKSRRGGASHATGQDIQRDGCAISRLKSIEQKPSSAFMHEEYEHEQMVTSAKRTTEIGFVAQTSNPARGIN
jgi:hypothetical protein